MEFDGIKERLGMDSEKTSKLRDSVSNDLKRLGGSEQKIKDAIKKLPKEKLATVSTMIEKAKDIAAEDAKMIDQLDGNAKKDFLNKIGNSIGKSLNGSDSKMIMAESKKVKSEPETGLTAASGKYYDRFKQFN